MYVKPASLYKFIAFLPAFGFMLLISSCKKTDTPSGQNEIASQKNEKQKEKVKQLKDFRVRLLAANSNEYGAAHVLPTLQNAWGLAWSTTGTPWVNAQAGHVSDVMDSIGNRISAIDPVNIPSPASLTGGGNPTGIVFNPNNGQFVIPAGNGGAAAAARFIFVGVDGVLSAWNPTWQHNAFRKAVNPGAYTGLTLASFNGANYLYAANFATRHIEVWDQTWAPVNWPGAFTDPHLPSDYSPFNIQVVGDKLYVMYAKVEGGEEAHGVGLGLVDIYTTNGMFVKRFATGGTLNAPWGVAMAPASFYKDDDDGDDDDAGPAILVGNFGDGRINAYRARDGKFLGQLSTHHMPIIIDGLWAISFAPPTSTINQNLLYFTAGPEDEQDGLFGYISRVSDND